MEHKTLAEIERAGEATPAVPLTRAERLDRWATALERLGPIRLNTLWRTEYVAPDALGRVRADNSPISVAFDDPMLRIAGLKDDTYEEAKHFFELSDHELHRIVCYCHFGPSLSGREAARLVRGLARRQSRERSWFMSLFAHH